MTFYAYMGLWRWLIFYELRVKCQYTYDFQRSIRPTLSAWSKGLEYESNSDDANIEQILA